MSAEPHPVAAWIGRRLWIRLAVMIGATFTLYVGSEVVLAFTVTRASGARHDIGLLAGVVACCLVMLGAYRLLVRGLERRSAVELAPRPGAFLFSAGLVWGALYFVLVLVGLAALGLAAFVGFRGPQSLAPAIAFSLLSAVGEELVFRATLLRILQEGFGSAVAIGVSALAFGLIHLVQPGANVVAAIAIAIEAGIPLALLYIWRDNLWLPIGLHFGWNFAEGGIFGQIVSGGRSHGLIEVALHGSPRLTGGAFGPEASPVAMALGLAVSAALVFLVLKTGRWRPFRRAAGRP